MSFDLGLWSKMNGDNENRLLSSATDTQTRIGVLIIDESSEYLQKIKDAFAKTSPRISVTSYNPSDKGFPAECFNFTAHQILFLDSNLGHYACFDVLRDPDSHDGPYTILMSNDYNENELEKLNIPGVSEFMLKSNLSGRSLTAIIDRATSFEYQEDTRTPYVASVYTDHPAKKKRYDIELPFDEKEIEEGNMVIDNYKITRLIGMGGMSAAYHAVRLTDSLDVVLKTLKPSVFDDGRVIDRFVTEYQIARNVTHENVVKIYDQRFSDDLVFIVMEYLPGESLTTRARHSVSPETAVKYALDIASALIGIHEAGIIHRDLKPANFHFNENDQLVLLDFGISKSISMDHGITKHGELIGTPYFMSPEQLMADTVDTRSDLFSLGIIIYMMLTGKHPFGKRNASTMMEVDAFDKPKPLPFKLDGIQEIIDELLQKDPDDRYQTAEQVYNDLVNVQEKFFK